MQYYNNKELLALDISKALHDPKFYAQFLSFARKYPEDVLLELLARALAAPKINNRAALFVSLVNGYDKTREL
jgi:hypothetical protein